MKHFISLAAAAATMLIGTDSFICIVVVIYNLKERRLFLHETFLTEKNRRLLHLAWFVAAVLRLRNPWEALQRYSRDS